MIPQKRREYLSLQEWARVPQEEGGRARWENGKTLPERQRAVPTRRLFEPPVPRRACDQCVGEHREAKEFFRRSEIEFNELRDDIFTHWLDSISDRLRLVVALIRLIRDV